MDLVPEIRACDAKEAVVEESDTDADQCHGGSVG